MLKRSIEICICLTGFVVCQAALASAAATPPTPSSPAAAHKPVTSAVPAMPALKGQESAATVTPDAQNASPANALAKPKTDLPKAEIANSANPQDNVESVMPTPKMNVTPAKQDEANDEVSSKDILDLATDVSLSAFNYDYRNYSKSLLTTEKYFTPEGWKKYEDALYQSKNLEIVKKDKLKVTAFLSGKASLVKQEVVEGGGKVWRVTVPLKVSYKGEHHQINQNLNINLGIIPYEGSSSDKGIAVTQFVARPA